MVVQTWLRPEDKVWLSRHGSGLTTKYGCPDLAPARRQIMVVQTWLRPEDKVWLSRRGSGLRTTYGCPDLSLEKEKCKPYFNSSWSQSMGFHISAQAVKITVKNENLDFKKNSINLRIFERDDIRHNVFVCHIVDCVVIILGVHCSVAPSNGQ